MKGIHYVEIEDNSRSVEMEHINRIVGIEENTRNVEVEFASRDVEVEMTYTIEEYNLITPFQLYPEEGEGVIWHTI